MLKKLMITGMTMLSLGSALAAHDEGGGKRKGGDFLNNPKVQEKLGLSDRQVADLKKIRDEAKPAREKQRDELKAAREKLKTLQQAEPRDWKAIDKQIDLVHSLMAAAQKDNARTMDKARSVLTEQQREQLKQFREQRRERMQEKRERRQERREQMREHRDDRDDD